jgi:Rps23 Pro-64 3,4-dihydroxylase Tpa1-like proline 4-hydroxylase
MNAGQGIRHNHNMLNPDLDRESIGQRLREAGRVVISDVLQPQIADALQTCLSNEIPWRLSCYDNRREPRERALKLAPEELAAMSPEKRHSLQREVMRQARDQFQYVYQSFDLLEGFRNKEKPGMLVYRLMQYFAEDAFFEFVHQVTGDTSINRIDGHATRYCAGHFLKLHGDESSFEQRRFAYVLGMTRNWHPDMGGLLHFLDDSGAVTESFTPSFNTLTLFKVPAPHVVSYVAPWVSGERLSITGWFTVY